MSHGGASGSTSASNDLGTVNGSSSLSSILLGPTGTAGHTTATTGRGLATAGRGRGVAITGHGVAAKTSRLQEMIATPHSRAAGATDRLRARSYSPLMRQALTHTGTAVSTASDRPPPAVMREALRHTGTAVSTASDRPQPAVMREALRHTGTAVSTASDRPSPAAASAAAVTSSLLSEPVRQSALSRQSYLYQLVADAERRPVADSSVERLTQHDGFPPLPTDDQLHRDDNDDDDDDDDDDASISTSMRCVSHGCKVRQSPFVTGMFLSSDKQQQPVKSFDYKLFQRTGSWVENRAARSGSLNSQTDRQTLTAVSVGRAGAGGVVRTGTAVSGHGMAQTGAGRVDMDTGRSVLDDAGQSASVSGVKPASHHEPCRHTYVSLFLSSPTLGVIRVGMGLGGGKYKFYAR